jgi:hypothetical protein
MNPKTKAVELVLKFSETTIQYDQAIKCALISVDEIIDVWHSHQIRSMEEWISVYQYWQDVKKEIRNL